MLHPVDNRTSPGEPGYSWKCSKLPLKAIGITAVSLPGNGNLGRICLDTQTEMISSLCQSPKNTQLDGKVYNSFLKKLGQFPQHLQTNTHGLHICGMSKSSWPGQRAHQSLPHRPLPTPGALTFSPASAWELPWASWVWREETHTFLQTKCKSYSCHWKYMLGLEFAFTHPHTGCQFSYNWNQRGKTLKI